MRYNLQHILIPVYFGGLMSHVIIGIKCLFASSSSSSSSGITVLGEF